MGGSGLHDCGLTELSELVRQREVSPVEILNAVLERIAKLDTRFNAFVTVVEERARNAAVHAEQEIAKGFRRGPLHGLPFAAKDLLASGDIPASVGMNIFRNRTTPTSATSIERLEAAGAILIGKLRQTEGTMVAYHPEDIPPVSPWNPAQWPGASSSGAGVALAARLCPATLSSDTGGSIRTPSALNGVTGLLPTWGRVSLDGAYPVAPTFDCVGPMARSAGDCALMLAAIAGYDPRDPYSLTAPVPDYSAQITQPVAGMIVGIDEHGLDGVDQRIITALENCRDVLESRGVQVKRVSYPETRAALDSWVKIALAELAFAHRETFEAYEDHYGPELHQLIKLGNEVTATDLLEASHTRIAFTRKMEILFEDMDAMLIPALSHPAPLLNEIKAVGDFRETYLDQARYQGVFNLSGQPTITFPAGLTESGSPVGLQLAGHGLGESTLLRLVHGFQQVTDWHSIKPTGLDESQY